MNTSQFVSKYTGQYVQFENDVADKGQCLPLVQVYMQQVQGIANPPATPSAKNYWLDFAALGLDRWYVQVPAGQEIADDISVYGPHGTFTDGHIAVCLGGGNFFEQNADPDGSPAHTFARANTYLLGSLRIKEITVGVTIKGTPASVSWGEGRIDVFSWGSDNGLWHKWYGNSAWQPWERVGDCVSSPSVSAWGENRLDVFFTGSAGDLVHIYYPANGTFSAPESLGEPQ